MASFLSFPDLPHWHAEGARQLLEGLYSGVLLLAAFEGRNVALREPDFLTSASCVAPPAWVDCDEELARHRRVHCAAASVPASNHRAADVLALSAGPRRQSLRATPGRAADGAASVEEVADLHRRSTGPPSPCSFKGGVVGPLENLWTAVYKRSKFTKDVQRRPEITALYGIPIQKFSSKCARHDSCRHIAIVKLDRLARSTRHLVTLAAELEALGVDLVVLDQAVDTTTPAGRLLFHVLSAIAEFERDLIRERVVAGLRHAQERGTRSGRPIGRPRRSVDAQDIQRRRAAGEPWRKIAQALKVPT